MAAIREIRSFGANGGDGTLSQWLKDRSYSNSIRLRAVMLILFWFVIGYIVVAPIAAIGGAPIDERIRMLFGIIPVQG